jgi:hypothetical protein
MPFKKTSKNEEKIDLTRRSLIKGTALGVGLAAAEKSGVFESEKFKDAVSLIGRAFERFSEIKKTSVENSPEQKNIALQFEEAFKQLENDADFFPRSLFSEELLIAQEMQESNFDPDARSQAGAVGVMQNMDISIKDIALFLEKLDRNKVIAYNGPIYIGNQEEKIEKLKEDVKVAIRSDDFVRVHALNQKLKKEEGALAQKLEKYGQRILRPVDLVALEKWRVHEPEHSRTLGKLYDVCLFNKPFGYGIGQEKFHDADFLGAQKEILAAYNGGLRTKNRDESEWPDETRDYVSKIMNLKDRIKNIRVVMSHQGLDSDKKEASKLIAKELSKVVESGPERKTVLSKATEHLVALLRQEEIRKQRQLKTEEMQQIIGQLASVKSINRNNIDTYTNES